jgi:hypothetical protein
MKLTFKAISPPQCLESEKGEGDSAHKLAKDIEKPYAGRFLLYKIEYIEA